jgi:hypothetical protein
MLKRIILSASAALMLVSSAFADDVAERTRYNPYTGTYNRTAAVYNPYTGRDAAVHTSTTPAVGGTTTAAGATYNPYTGNYHGGTAAVTSTGTRDESKTYYNPATGRVDHVQGAYNPYTGRYAVHGSTYRR